MVAHCANFCLNPTSPSSAMASPSDCGGISCVRIPSESCGIFHPVLTGFDLGVGVRYYFVVSKGHGMCPAYVVSEWATLNTTEVAAVRSLLQRAGQPTNDMASVSCGPLGAEPRCGTSLGCGRNAGTSGMEAVPLRSAQLMEQQKTATRQQQQQTNEKRQTNNKKLNKNKSHHKLVLHSMCQTPVESSDQACHFSRPFSVETPAEPSSFHNLVKRLSIRFV